MLFSFISGGRIPHPSIVLLFLSIYTCVVSYKKKNDIWLVDLSVKNSCHSDNSLEQVLELISFASAAYDLHVSMNRNNLMGLVLNYQVSISGLKVRLLMVVALKLGNKGYIG